MAKDPKLEQETDDIEEVVEETPKKRSPRLFILLGFISLILLQATMLFLLLPSQKQVADDLDKLRQRDPWAVAVTDPPEDNTVKSIDLVEKPLGDKFSVQDISPRNPAETEIFSVKVTLRIDKKDEAAFDKLFLQRTETLRDTVYAVLRSSTMEERNSETLSAIKTRIRIRVNEELGANFVKDVRCTEPSHAIM